MENYEKAEQDYMQGMKYKDIALKYGTTINTVKSWKKRYGWCRKGAHKNKKGCTQKNAPPAEDIRLIADGTEDTMKNDDLNPEQQMFCVYYSRTFNATQSYLKAYECSYESAVANGSRLLTNDNIKSEIERLKEIKRQIVLAGEEDIVELQMRIAFADIGNYVKFGEAGVVLKESTQVDTQLIKKVTEGKAGVYIELEDRQKAIDWLSKYFLIHPDDKYKAEFDKKRAGMDGSSDQNILKNMQTIIDVLRTPVPNRDIEAFEEVDPEEHTGTAE